MCQLHKAFSKQLRRSLVVAGVTILLAAGARAQQPVSFNKRHVTFKSGGLTLAGYLYQPPGPGPFPAVLWNHGSEPDPGGGPQFDSVAAVFVPAGFVVFAPMRRGHSDSQGEYIRESIQQESSLHGQAAGLRLGVHLLETSQVDDQLAGLAFLKGRRSSTRPGSWCPAARSAEFKRSSAPRATSAIGRPYPSRRPR